MTGTPDERTARALRAMLADRIDTLAPPPRLYETVRRRHRRRQVAAVAGVAAATAVVVPVGLLRPGPAPTAGTGACAVGPADPVPAAELPAQSGVRGSLGDDDRLVRAVLAAGWTGLVRDGSGGWALDPASARVRFVERTGDGLLALVTATDRSGGWQAGEWVSGPASAPAPTGGTGLAAGSADRGQGRLFGGDDPLVIASRPACGRTWTVVLAPAGATATATGAARIDADGRAATAPARDLPLTDGLAVVPADGPGPTVAVTRGGRPLAVRVLGADGPVDPARGPSADEIAAAVRDAADPGPAEAVVRVAVTAVLRGTADDVTGVRVLWSERRPGAAPAVLVALTLPSGAAYVAGGAGTTSSPFSGLLPAGRVDRAVLAWPDGDLLYVRAPGAVRAEADVTGVDRPAGTPGTARVPVPLAGGGGRVHLIAGATATAVRAYAADGGLIAEVVPGAGLLPLPGG